MLYLQRGQEAAELAGDAASLASEELQCIRILLLGHQANQEDDSQQRLSIRLIWRKERKLLSHLLPVE